MLLGYFMGEKRVTAGSFIDYLKSNEGRNMFRVVTLNTEWLKSRHEGQQLQAERGEFPLRPWDTSSWVSTPGPPNLQQCWYKEMIHRGHLSPSICRAVPTHPRQSTPAAYPQAFTTLRYHSLMSARWLRMTLARGYAAMSSAANTEATASITATEWPIRASNSPAVVVVFP